jgi:quercetin dioxygenase-like cupin family protein
MGAAAILRSHSILPQSPPPHGATLRPGLELPCLARRFVMTKLLSIVVGGALLAVAPFAAGAQTMDHQLLAADEIKWSAGPPSIPAGAQAAVLYGDPAKEGQFAFRLRTPKDYAIAPHTHPKPEIVTVISGQVRLGMGTSADREKAKVLPAGSFFALSPGMAHYYFSDEDSVIQLNSIGPWSIDYVDAKDDPRQTVGTTKK